VIHGTYFHGTYYRRRPKIKATHVYNLSVVVLAALRSCWKLTKDEAQHNRRKMANL
jgi:hypothetical protein